MAFADKTKAIKCELNRLSNRGMEVDHIIIFNNVNHRNIFNNVAGNIFLHRTMVSFGISYDNSKDELDDEETDIIDQQNDEFATRTVRAKTDHERLKMILSQPSWE